MIDIINDISILTSISKLSLENLSNKAIECIAHGVQETLNQNDNIILNHKYNDLDCIQTFS